MFSLYRPLNKEFYPFFQSLPSEIIITIFEKIPDFTTFLRLGSSCKLFNAIVRDDRIFSKRLTSLFRQTFYPKENVFKNFLDLFNPLWIRNGVWTKLNFPQKLTSLDYQLHTNKNWIGIQFLTTPIILFWNRWTSQKYLLNIDFFPFKNLYLLEDKILILNENEGKVIGIADNQVIYHFSFT